LLKIYCADMKRGLTKRAADLRQRARPKVK